jgi:WS/DGAT/MGAT family acyltransferase
MVGGAVVPTEQLANIDAAWLRMEDASHPMAITVAMIFGAPLDLKPVRAVFEDRLLRFRRFRQRVIQPAQPADRPYWEDDPQFDLDYHLQAITLQPPGDEAALRDLISTLMSTQLDLSRPLWQFHLVQQYGEGSALVGRVHHCLADGPALLHVLAALTGEDQADPNAAAEPEVSPAHPDRSLAAAALEATAWAAETLAQEGVKILRNPLHLLRLARLGTGSTSALSKLLFRPPDPKTAFRGKLGTAKRVAWSAPIALEEVTEVGGVVDGTVNDVMLAAATGALRRYLQSRGEAVDELAIRTGLSVNLRSPDMAPQLGNQAGAFLVSLPIGSADPLERLRTVKRTVDALKESPEGAMVYGLLNALGMAPADTQDALVKRYCTGETAMTANVPGPREMIHLAGAPLEMLLFWVPAFGSVGLNLNLVSYAGHMRLGVATDAGLVPDPETIADQFSVEFEALRASAGGPGARDGVDAAREGSMAEMSAMLDEATRTLDALLERQEHDSRGSLLG